MALLFASPSLAQSAPGLPQSAIANPYLFQGARYDAETGFYYFRNRYYDPRAGRFLQRDPVWDQQNVGGWHTFAANNPPSLADPSGEVLPLVVVVGLKILLGGALAGGGIVGYRQVVQYASGERPAHTFTFSECAKQTGGGAAVGAMLAPGVALAPEVTIPVLTGVGLTSAYQEYQADRPATAAFDAVTAVAPWGSRSVRGQVFGRGTLWRPGTQVAPHQTRLQVMTGRLKRFGVLSRTTSDVAMRFRELGGPAELRSWRNALVSEEFVYSERSAWRARIAEWVEAGCITQEQGRFLLEPENLLALIRQAHSGPVVRAGGILIELPEAAMPEDVGPGGFIDISDLVSFPRALPGTEGLAPVVMPGTPR
jgi:RHS repeat-associated protein